MCLLFVVILNSLNSYYFYLASVLDFFILVFQLFLFQIVAKVKQINKIV